MQKVVDVALLDNTPTRALLLHQHRVGTDRQVSGEQERDIPVAPPRSEEREEASDRGRSIHEYFNDPVNKRVKSASRANRGKYSNSAEIC